jgi:hypothetical protein
VSHQARFMANNYASSSTLVSYSSQHSSFPMSNLLNQSRNILAKFNGNFTVTASNKTLYINDGADKTITLTEASYTGTTLASHIQTQLNASSSSWTVTYSTSTYKFTIARGASGTLRFSQTSNAAWDLLGYTASSNATGTSFVADEQRNHSEEWVKFDFLTQRPVDFVALLGRIDRAFSLSSSATVKLQLNNSDAWTSPSVDASITRHDRGAFRFQDDLGSSSYRYCRIYIRDRLNTAGPNLELAHVYVGDYVTFSTTNVGLGFQKSTVDPSERVESDAGAVFWRRKPKYRKFSNVNVGQILASERQAVESLFETVGLTTSFYMSIDPTLVISTELAELTAYVNFASEPTFTHVIRDYFNMSAEMREAV